MDIAAARAVALISDIAPREPFFAAAVIGYHRQSGISL